MNIVFEQFGSLVLTFVGFVVPVLGTLLALFPDGIKKLRLEYENQIKQSETNIENELQKREKTKPLDLAGLQTNLQSLTLKKRTAERKLSLLDPKKQLLRLAAPLLISFCGTLIALVANNPLGSYIIFIGSVALFIYSLLILWQLLEVLKEVREIIGTEKEDTQNKVIELLSTLVEKTISPSDSPPFLSPEKIWVKFKNEKIENNVKVPVSVNNKHEVLISILNQDSKMAKNVELGLIFPPDFIIEKTNNVDSIYSDEKRQIVRFKEEFIQADTNKLQGNLNITPLKIGAHEIRTFIKGENIKNKEQKFILEPVA